MSKRLFVTDLDGTLLNAQSRVSPWSAHAISEMSAKGALITVATARTPATVDGLLSHTSLSLPAIVMTGAALWDRATRRYELCKFIDEAVSNEILEVCRQGGITPFIYTLGADGFLHTYFNGSMSNRDQRFAAERNGLPLKRMHINEKRMAEVRSFADSLLYFAMGPKERVESVAKVLSEKVECSVSCYNDIFSHSTSILEIFAAGVSKASAVKAMSDRLGVDSITVFGDNLNDLAMMGVADEAVAVANAFPEVKAAADFVIGANTEDSVARYILEQCSQDVKSL